MKLLSARQSWHDALHESRDSVMAIAAEMAKNKRKERPGDDRIIIMLENENGEQVAHSYPVRKNKVKETRPGSRLTDARCAHMLAAGIVLHAIDSLPKPVQHFGHFLYSPIATGNDLAIAHAVAWLGSGLDSMTDRRRERAYWMALAALQSHKQMVHDREGMSPGDVCMFIEERTGLRMDPCNWVRDWRAIWDKLAMHIDKVDARALAPVAEVVERMREREDAA